MAISMFAKPEKETGFPARWSRDSRSEGYSPESTGRGFYYGWIVVISSFFIGFMFFGLRFSFGVFFKSLESEFGLSRASTSSIVSLNLLLGCVFCIAGGWALDRYGPRLIVALMGLITGISLLLVSQAGEVWHIYLSYGVLLALGSGGMFTVMAATVSRWFTRMRGLVVAIVTSGFNLGLTAIAPLAAYLISTYDWRISYIILGGAGLVVVIPLALLLRNPPEQIRGAMVNDNASVGDFRIEEPVSQEGEGLSVLQMARTWSFWVNFILWFGFGACMFLIQTHMVPHAVDLGFSDTQGATVVSIQSSMSIIGRFATGSLCDSLGNKRVSAICFLFMGLAMAWLMWASDLWGLYLFAIAFGFASGGISVAFVGLATDIFGVRHLGAMIGILDAGHSLGAALGPLFAGYIFDVSGSYFLAFLTCVLVLVLLIVLVLPIKIPETKIKSAMLY